MSGFFVGHFSNPKYDTCAYPEDLYQSTAPYEYVMNPDRIHNCRGGLTTFGPRSSYLGAGVSAPEGDVIAAAQQYVDIDSVASNRNVPLSRCKRGKVNPVDITRIKTVDVQILDDYLDAQPTRLSDPPMFYRGAPINRFYDLNKDPQANIFYDWSVNTSLEARDNFVPDLPVPLETDGVPQLPMQSRIPPRDPSWNPVALEIRGNGNCSNRGCDWGSDRNMTRTARNNVLNERKARGRGVPRNY